MLRDTEDEDEELDAIRAATPSHVAIDVADAAVRARVRVAVGEQDREVTLARRGNDRVVVLDLAAEIAQRFAVGRSAAGGIIDVEDAAVERGAFRCIVQFLHLDGGLAGFEIAPVVDRAAADPNIVDTIECGHNATAGRKMALAVIREPVGKVLHRCLVLSVTIEVIAFDLVAD